MIRVLLDFSRIESQIEKFVWFAVDTLSSLTIKCVKDSICSTFNLTNIQLYVKEGFLRDESTIFVLRDEDTVRIIQRKEKTPKNNVSSVTVCHKKKKRRLDYDLEFADKEKQEELAIDDLSFSQEIQTQTEKTAKKKKKKHRKNESDSEITVSSNTKRHSNVESVKVNLPSRANVNFETEHARNSPLPNSDIRTPISKKQVSSDKANESLMEITMCGVAKNTVSPTANSGPTKRHKRIRRRHRKRKSDIATTAISEFLDYSRNDDTVRKVEANSKAVSVNGISDKFATNNGVKNKHIKFVESSEDSDGDDEIVEASVVEFSSFFSSNNSALTPLPHSSYEPTSPHSLEQTVNTKPENCSLHAFPSPSKIFEKSVTSSPKPSNSSPTDQIGDKEIKKEQIIKNNRYTPLNVRPAVGAHIAFKMLELTEMYSPVVSDFKEGVVKSIDSSENIEIELSQEEVKAPRSGKFEVIYENESEPESEVVKMVTVNWNEMLDPQIIIA